MVNSMKRKLPVRLLVVVMLLALLPLGASATPGDEFNITSISVLLGGAPLGNNVVDQWSDLEFTLSFTLKDGAFSGGDIVVITLPDLLEFTAHHQQANTLSVEFPLFVNGTTEEFAEAQIDVSNKTITLTFANYINGKSGLSGNLKFWLELDESKTDNQKLTEEKKENLEFTITTSGGSFPSPVIPDIGYEFVPTNAYEDLDKWGIVYYDEVGDYYYIDYGVAVNMGSPTGNPPYGTCFTGQAVITDTLQNISGSIIADSFDIEVGGFAYDVLGWTDAGVKYFSGTESAINTRFATEYGSDEMVLAVNNTTGFSLTVKEIEGKQIWIGYRVKLSYNKSNPPVADHAFNNVVSVQSSKPSAQLSNVAHYRIGGLGSGIGDDYSIVITKKDSANQSVLLEGAEFELYASDGNGAKTGAAIKNSIAGTGTDAGKYTFTGLFPGNYWIVETVAPNGYVLNPTPRGVTVGSDTNLIQYVGIENSLTSTPTTPPPSSSEPSSEPSRPDGGSDDSGDSETPVTPGTPITPVTPEVPARPNPPGPSTEGGRLVPNEDGSYTEFDENDVPLGYWTWDEQQLLWIFEKAVPLSDMIPQTGSGATATLNGVFALGVAGVALVGTIPKCRKSKR